MTSTYGTSPPSSRLPPDGHEFPGDYLDDSGSHAKLSVTRTGAAPPAGPWRSAGSSAPTGGRDERSERSVRDKIALFTSESSGANHAAARPLNPVKYPPLSCSVDNLAVGRSPMISPVTRPSVRTLAPDLTERSRSLLDVASHRNSAINSQRKSSSFEPRRKSSLSSKLRGLVIPDESKSDAINRPVIDLPEIISKDSVLVVGIAPLTPPLRSPGSQHSGQDEADNSPKSSPLSSLPWKSNSSTLPKYSPAFKRKELSVARSSCYPSHQQEAPAPPSAKPPPPLPPPPPALSTVYSSSSDVGEDKEQANNSDTDSAVSSSRSSFSPANSPVPERRTNPLQVESIGGRVLKAQSVEALNRKNVLQSARFSSGGNSLYDLTPAAPLLPEMRTTQRSGVTKSGDFEQTLKKFAIAEAQSRIERTAPPRTRLSSSERIEVKTAMITDVCVESSSPKATSPLQHEPKKPVASDYRTGKEIKSFRALAERWEAISTSETSAGSSPPAHISNNNNNMSTVNSNTSKKGEVKEEEKSVPPVPRTVTTRSVSAGVVEIRKAFERVKEELETESNCALDGQHDDYPGYKQHSIFALQHQSSASSLVSGHARMSSLDSTTSEDGLPFGYGIGSSIFASGFHYGYGGYGGPFGIGVRDNYGSITSLASSTSLISPQVTFCFYLSVC